MPGTALLVAAFDSQLKWCASIRDELVARGFDYRVVVPDRRSALSADQIRDGGFRTVSEVSWTELLAAADQADVVVSALSGPATRELLVDLADRPAGLRRPVLVCGWVGVIIEKVIAGYLDRCGADVVAVNAQSDLAAFHQVARELSLPTGNLLLSGLPLLGSEPPPPRGGPIGKVVFADQPTVPGPRDERLYLYRRLIAYARRHPDRQVVLKPRHRPDEDTFHRMLHHPEKLLAGIPRPGNLVIDYTSITDQLPSTDLLLTVSSTAALEAIDHGCRVGLVLDLGIHERYGNQVFLSSGLLRTFDQIETDDLAAVDPDWQRSYFFPRIGSAAQLVVDRIEELLRTGERPGQAVWTSDYFLSSATFHRTVVAPRRGVRRPPGRFGRRALRIGRAVLPPVLVKPLRRIAQQVATWRARLATGPGRQRQAKENPA